MLIFFLEENGLLSKNQLGFRAGIDTGLFIWGGLNKGILKQLQVNQNYIV